MLSDYWVLQHRRWSENWRTTGMVVKYLSWDGRWVPMYRDGKPNPAVRRFSQPGYLPQENTGFRLMKDPLLS